MQVVSSLGIHAVAYLSKRMDDFYAYPHAVNLAILIPQTNLCSDNQYWDCSSGVELTEPYLFSNFLTTDAKSYPMTFINKFYGEGANKEVCLMGNLYNYTNLVFAKFDEFLHQLSKSPFCSDTKS